MARFYWFHHWRCVFDQNRGLSGHFISYDYWFFLGGDHRPTIFCENLENGFHSKPTILATDSYLLGIFHPIRIREGGGRSGDYSLSSFITDIPFFFTVLPMGYRDERPSLKLEKPIDIPGLESGRPFSLSSVTGLCSGKND